MTVHFAVPGPLEQRTGGYLYDREMVHGLRAMGHDLHVHEMAGAFPLPDDAARQSARRILARLESGGCLVIDGLALPAFTDALPRRPRRDSVVGLIHHPLALETGLTAAAARQLDALERRALAQLDGVICTSESTRQALVGRGYDGARVRVV
ncbi:MAG: glycosyltransferase, partial [Pseudomonadota bacterium]|nr:glycosyltransferase [Pseudomonadota bacterium]